MKKGENHHEKRGKRPCHSSVFTQLFSEDIFPIRPGIRVLGFMPFCLHLPPFTCRVAPKARRHEVSRSVVHGGDTPPGEKVSAFRFRLCGGRSATRTANASFRTQPCEFTRVPACKYLFFLATCFGRAFTRCIRMPLNSHIFCVWCGFLSPRFNYLSPLL